MYKKFHHLPIVLKNLKALIVEHDLNSFLFHLNWF